LAKKWLNPPANRWQQTVIVDEESSADILFINALNPTAQIK
jgi:hypothetical protein